MGSNKSKSKIITEDRKLAEKKSLAETPENKIKPWDTPLQVGHSFDRPQSGQRSWNTINEEGLNLLLIEYNIKSKKFRLELVKLMIKRPALRDTIFNKILDCRKKGEKFTLMELWNIAMSLNVGRISILKSYYSLFPDGYASLFCIATRYNDIGKYSKASLYIEMALKQYLTKPKVYTKWLDSTSSIYNLRACISKNIGNFYDFRINMLLAIEKCENPVTRFGLITSLRDDDIKTGEINRVYEEYCTSKAIQLKMTERIQMLENELAFKPGGIGAVAAHTRFEENKKELESDVEK